MNELMKPRCERVTLDRLLSRTTLKSETGCMEWNGCLLDKHRYGRICRVINGKAYGYYVHRVVFELVNGTIQDGVQVLHSCDNERCINPTHLHEGTRKLNMQEKLCRRRGGAIQKLGPKEISEIRSTYALGNETQSMLGKKYNVRQSYISQIVNRRAWAYV